MNADLIIRPGAAGDLAGVTAIYNHYVTETHNTFDTETFAVGARTQWFTQFSPEGPHQLLVGTIDGTVVGYASSCAFKKKAAYRTSVETTVYLAPDRTGTGHGKTLYSALVEQLSAHPEVHRAYGLVALPNAASVALHEQLGFHKVATLHEVGFKFGKFWDVSWFEKEV